MSSALHHEIADRLDAIPHLLADPAANPHRVPAHHRAPHREGEDEGEDPPDGE